MGSCNGVEGQGPWGNGGGAPPSGEIERGKKKEGEKEGKSSEPAAKEIIKGMKQKQNTFRDGKEG